MKELFKTMVNHPIASFIVVGTVLDGIAGIIRAAKGEPNQSGLTIQLTKPESTSEG